MAYDLEKYRDKREKVLGRKKRGLSFGTMAVLVSGLIILGLGVAVVPKAVAFFNTRNLDDAIYKLQNRTAMPAQLGPELMRDLHGVKEIEADSHGARIVVTFDRSMTGAEKIAAYLRQKGVDTVLLNQVSRRQRLATLRKEAEF